MSNKKLQSHKAGTVTFVDPQEIQRKAVRGLLRKRAKKYDSDSDDDKTEKREKKWEKKKPRTEEKTFKADNKGA
jgi:hypothetical protein